MNYREPFTVVSRVHEEAGLRTTHVEAYNPTDAMVQAQQALKAYGLTVTEQTCFVGHQRECDPNEVEFDFAYHALEKVDEQEGELFNNMITGNLSGQVAIMTCFYGREPTHVLVNVHQAENDEVLIQPLYVRLTESMLEHVRSDDGEPVVALEDGTH